MRITISINLNWMRSLIHNALAHWYDWNLKHMNPMAPQYRKYILKRSEIK